MTGIYKITSPSNKVYIGQSWNITRRVGDYRKVKCHKGKLLNSLIKYGFDAHTVEVVHELPKDTTQEVMDNYEKTYLDFHVSAGVSVLNLREPGSRGRHSQESIKKMISSNKGKVISEEARQKMSLAKKGKSISKERLDKFFAGRRPLTPDEIKKQALSRTGAKRTPESREKMSLAHKGKPWSEKRRMAQKKTV